jgi:hypothetical protein
MAPAFRRVRDVLAPERDQRQTVRFPCDDYAGQSSDVSVAKPQYAVVAVGW